ncbi:condensation domain-containing protein [Gordonia polyisoprenivorans]|uniref:condensation domain-containing protein n=1 Tax=Gordonia polyisoprenivorans TaxID=84595 RepID=UPI001EE67D50|nr:condensation domain-containing protein [Gordonia polyisoprenivorans]
MEWTIRSPDRARLGSSPSGAGTFLQSDHLATAVAARLRGEPHRAIIGSLTRFDEPLDADAMAQALTDFVRRHEELRAHYVVDESGITRVVAPPDSVEMITTVPDPDLTLDEASVGEYAAQRITSLTDFDSVPAMAFGAAAGERGFTFYLGADHVHGDGYSVWLALAEIVALYRARVHGEPAGLPSVGKYADFIRAEAMSAAAVAADADSVHTWRAALRAKGGVPTSPLDLGLDGDTAVPAVRARRDLIDADDAARIDERLAGTGCTFTGCLYAAMASAQFAVTGDRLFCTTTALATRPPGHERTQGWLCNFAPICFEVDPDADFVSLIGAATDAVRDARSAAAAPVGAVLGVLAQTGELPPITGSPQMVTYLDHRRLPGVEDPTVRTTVGFPGVGKTKNANLWVSRMTDCVTVETQIPDNATARRNIGAYLDAIADILHDFAAGVERPAPRTGSTGAAV